MSRSRSPSVLEAEWGGRWERRDRSGFLRAKESVSCSVVSDSLWAHVAHQAPLSMEFSRQDYWSGWPFPSPGVVPNPGVETWVSCIAGVFFTSWATSEEKGRLFVEAVPMLVLVIASADFKRYYVVVETSPSTSCCAFSGNSKTVYKSTLWRLRLWHQWRGEHLVMNLTFWGYVWV